MPFVDIHDAKIRYREGGTGRAGPPALFIHGAGASSTIWLSALHRVAPLRRAVAFDLPGHGRSTVGAATFDELLAAASETAATLCLGRSILVGHSLGGLLAMAAALAYPDKVAGLVLVATGPMFTVSRQLFAAIDGWSGWPEFLGDVGHSRATPADVRRRSTSLASGAGKEQTRADFIACTQRDVTAELGAIRAPTLIISGDDDRFVPKTSPDLLEARIAGAERVRLARCGHFPMHERPDAFGAALTHFIAKIGA